MSVPSERQVSLITLLSLVTNLSHIFLLSVLYITNSVLRHETVEISIDLGPLSGSSKARVLSAALETLAATFSALIAEPDSNEYMLEVVSLSELSVFLELLVV